MKKLLLLILSLLLIFINSNAQLNANIIWQNTIGGSSIEEIGKECILKTSDGGYLLAGKSYSNISGDKTEPNIGGDDYWIVKVDALGNVEWDKTIGGSSDDELTTIVSTVDGGYLLGGHSFSGVSGDKTEPSIGNYDYWIVKIDGLGNVQWDKTIGGLLNEKLATIVSTIDGGYLLGGYSESNVSGDKTEPNLGGNDYWIVKIDGLGNVLWDKTIGGSANDFLYKVFSTVDGGWLLGGSSFSNVSGDKTEPSIGFNDYWIVKIDGLGNVQWDKTIGGSDYEYLSTIVSTVDGGYLLGGHSSSGVSGDKTEPNIGGYDYWIIKVDALGNVEWDKSIGGTQTDNLNIIVNTVDGGYLLGGKSLSGISGDKTESNMGSSDYWIVKIDGLGNVQWDKTIGGASTDNLNAIINDVNGGYLLGGYSFSGVSGDKTEPSLGINDYWIVKLDCVYELDTMPNVISPLSQTVCKMQIPNSILGSDDDLLSVDAVSYIWQQSTDNVNWVDIPGAISKDYLPSPTSSDTWYRRINNWNCQQSDTSDVHALMVTNDVAPVADAGSELFLFCTGGSVTIGGTPTAINGQGPYTYNWTPSLGLDDNSIANPTASLNSGGGVYQVTVTDGNGCTAISQAQVSLASVDAGPDVTTCVNTPVAIGSDPIVGTPAVTYSWTLISGDGLPNDLTTSILVVSPTVTSQYQLEMIGPDGCPLVDTVIVNVIPDPVALATDVTICLGDNTIIGTPADANYTYHWSSFNGSDVTLLSNTEIAQPIFDGAQLLPPINEVSYVLTVTDNEYNCAVSYDTMLINIRTVPTTPSNECYPAFIGVSLPGTNYDYLWSVISGDATTIVGQETDSIIYVSPNANTDYQLAVTYNNVTCLYNTYVSLDGPCEIIINDAYTLDVPHNCVNQVLPFVFGAIADTNLFDVEWTGNLGLLGSSNLPQTSLISPITTSEVFVRLLKDKNGNVLSTSTYTLIPIAIPTYSFDETDLTKCFYDSINIGTTPVAGFSYLWTPSTGLNDATIADPLCWATNTSTYQLTVTDDASGCEFNYVKTINVIGSQDISAGQDQNFCSGAIVTWGTPAVTGWDYSWLPNVGLDNPTSALQTDTLYSNLQFYLTASESFSGLNCIVQDTVDLIMVSTTSADAGTGGTICPLPGAPGVQLGTTDNSAQGTTYLWSPSTGLDDPTSATPIATPQTETIYTVLVNNGVGCGSISHTTVSVDPIQDLNLSALSDVDLCEEDSVQIGIAPTVGFVYLWTPTDSLTCETCSQTYVHPTETTTYELAVVDTVNCSTDVLTITVNVTGKPELLSSNNETICQNESVGLSVNETVGYTYSWTPTNDLSCTSCFQTEASPIITTTYFITASLNTCSYTDSVIVTVNDIPTADAGLDKAVCNTSVIIGSPSVIGDIYEWSPTVGLNNSTIAEPTALPNIETDYILTVTNASNCSATDTVTITPAYSLSLNNNVSICNGSEIQIGLSTDLGFTYSWSPTVGLDNPSIYNPTASPTTSTNYTLSVDDGNGCIRTVDVFVEVIEPGVLSINAPAVVCQNGCATLEGVVVSGGFSQYSWSPSLNLDSPTSLVTNFCPTETNTYTLLGFDANGCEVTADVLVNLSPNPAPVANAGLDTLLCMGESIQIGTPEVAGMQYIWSPVLGLAPNGYVAQPTYTPTNSDLTHTFNLQVIDPLTGCQNNDEITVMYQNVTVNLGNDLFLCEGDSLELNATTSGTTNYIEYLWSPANGLSCTDCANPKAHPSVTTTYTVMITDTVTNCTAFDEVTITQTGEVSPQISLDDILFCSDVDYQIDLNNELGYTYTWSNPLGVTVSDLQIPNPIVNPNGVNQFDMVLTTTNTNNTYCPSSQTSVHFSKYDIISLAIPDVTLCPGESSVEIGTVPADVSGDYIYEWVPATNLNSNTIANPTATVSSNTNYSVTINYSNSVGITYVGCQTFESMTINIESPIIIDAGQDFAFCDGDMNPVQIGEGYVYPNIPPLTSYLASDLPINISNQSITSQILVNTNGALINDLNVNMNYFNSLINGFYAVNLISPSGTNVVILNLFQVNGSNVFDATLDDEGVTGFPFVPTNNISHVPSNPLSIFDGEPADGIWTIMLTPFPNVSSTGQLNDWGLEFELLGGGTSPYSWSPGLGLSDSLTARPYVFNLGTNQEYVLTVTTAAGCTTTDTINVQVGSPNFNIIGDTTVCVNALPVTYTSIGNMTYDWSIQSADATIVGDTVNQDLVVQFGLDNTIIDLAITDQYGCMAFDTIDIVINDLPIVQVLDNVSGCISGDDLNFTATPIPNSNTTGVFDSQNGLIDNGDGTSILNVSDLQSGLYQIVYVYTDTNGCVNSDTVIANLYNCLINIVKTGEFNDENENNYGDVGETITYTFTITNTGDTLLSNIVLNDPLLQAPNPIVTITGPNGDLNSDNQLDTNEIWVYSATYTLTEENITSGFVFNKATISANGVSPNSDTVTVVIPLKPFDGISIPEGFSPNKDEINDVLVIKGIENYSNASITIFNRWGNKVYESTNGYNNDWDGRNQFGLTIGSRDLPEGTYFYILDLGDGSEVIKGYVYLNR